MDVRKKWKGDSAFDRAKTVTKLSIPAIITNLIMRIQDITNISFLGHYKPENDKKGALLAGVGLAQVFGNLLGF